MESAASNRTGLVIETLLFYLRHRYLSATECLVFLWLHEIADEAGCGNVHATNLAEELGRSRSRCRNYLKRLEHHGLIEALRDGRCGRSFYRLETAVMDAAKNRGSRDHGRPAGPTREPGQVSPLAMRQHPANPRLAPASAPPLEMSTGSPDPAAPDRPCSVKLLQPTPIRSARRSAAAVGIRN